MEFKYPNGAPRFLCWLEQVHSQECRRCEGERKLMFAAVLVNTAFGHVLASDYAVGPVGTVAGHRRTEEPGEQRFCINQRLEQPMGLPFSEWAGVNISRMA